ncbi:MAG: RluA family pseudouridine synthase [Rhizobiales bacterium]|nr:RluA family pseudouridine synthase [Hyphomicrobiales bacterium]
MTVPAVEPLTVTAADAGRLDKVLAGLCAGISRARFQSLIASGNVSVNGRTIVEARHPVKPGDEITARVPPAEEAEPEGEAMDLDIVHEDADVLVIDKPAGLVVHPGPGNWTGTLVNGIIAHCGDTLSGIGGIRRPGIVHRLDKETSGLLVIAKNDRAHASLSAQFAAHGRDGRLERAYDALVWGHPARRRGTIDEPIGRHPSNRQKMAVSRSPTARRAITHYEIGQFFPAGDAPGRVTRIRCRLETGRTHQIRVHMAHLGHPILGDAVYGSGFKASAGKLPQKAQSALAGLGRQALHASVLGFEHPTSGEIVSFASELPADFGKLLDALIAW